MKYMCPMLVVENMQISRTFYETVLRQKVVLDFGANITFEGSFSLQTKSTWTDFIRKTGDDIKFGGNNFELDFEEEDFEGFLKHLENFPDVERLHDIIEYPWGQKVIRFYDPDRHIIEVGESMVSVVKRFLEEGLSIEAVSQRTMYPVEFVMMCKNGFPTEKQ